MHARTDVLCNDQLNNFPGKVKIVQLEVRAAALYGKQFGLLMSKAISQAQNEQIIPAIGA